MFAGLLGLEGSDAFGDAVFPGPGSGPGVCWAVGSRDGGVVGRRASPELGVSCEVGSTVKGSNVSASSGGGVLTGQGCGKPSVEGFTEGRGVETFLPRPIPGRLGLVDSKEGNVLATSLLAEGIKERRRLGRSRDPFGVVAFFPRPCSGWSG